ncbi:hypothetical protein AQPE_4540 [Aquipluma nitroreducens]|uniref:Uncharacterized protein n=1 Tax=Aquipluma nitroreducens TaxID=2010828 RepID=A0A5K7SFU5_9BACT|nr:hypothetical protein [Aquipluma nitroreducens]BBE20349.1 hypothetical protein AQPE_4540 [Aquipluma nitroreducens]
MRFSVAQEFIGLFFDQHDSGYLLYNISFQAKMLVIIPFSRFSDFEFSNISTIIASS